MNIKIVSGIVGAVSLLAMSVVNAATITLSPATQTVAVGDTVTIDILASGFDAGWSQGSVQLTWDSAVLTLDSLTGNGDAGVNTQIFVKDNTIATGGSLLYGAAIGFFDLPLAGPNFTFGRLSFTANPPPGETTAMVFNFVNGGLWRDANDNDITNTITFDPTGATVTVNAVPVPPAVWLFGSGLLGLVGIARRRQSRAA